MSTFTPGTEVQEMELDPSNLTIRLQGSINTEDEFAGIPQLELLDRVEDILKKIRDVLSRNFDKLPSEFQQLDASKRPGDLLQRLNLVVQDHDLDDFLQQHPSSRQLFSQLFGCRYPYLEEHNLRGSGSSNLTSKDALSECVNAYNVSDSLHDESVGNLATTRPLSLQELEIVERMYQHIDTLLSKESVSKAIQGVQNMEPPLEAATAECFANLSDISQRFQKEFQKKIFGQMPAKSGIELEKNIGSSSSREDTDKDGGLRESINVEDELTYKGWYIEGPRIQLARAKNFLADGDINRTVDWKRKCAEIMDYCGHLQSKFRGEDWIHDVDEVLYMLVAHRIFEGYYYGKPQLIVNFPTDFWPKRSTRLPQLDGPNIEFRAESSQKHDSTSPRRLLHVDVTSAHDRQYEMPTDVLRRDYLEPYLNDCENFWATGPFADATEPINLAASENKIYEDCMKGGMAKTARFLASKDSFLPPHQSHDSALRVKRETLEGFARFRGGKRAALQQCLNVFNHDENRKMCTPLRVLTLPELPVEKKPDAGIIYTNKMLANPPEKESRDPWAYTRAYQWFKKEELRWAQWTREHVIKESFGHKQRLQSDKPVMELPQNWKGPVLPDLMDRDMKKTYEFLRRCQKILQGLKRAEKRAPRHFITRLLEAVDIGTVMKPVSKEMKLRFGEHEYESTDGATFTLANLRPTEAAWLEYICQPSRNRPQELEESLGKRGEIMVSRVTQMMQDIDPFSLFWDTEPKTLDKFLRELNSTCGGEVKRYEFTEKDVKQLAPKLRDLQILKLYENEVTREWMFGRPETEFHPEDLIKWPGHGLQMHLFPEKYPLAYYTSQVELQSNNKDQIQDSTCEAPDNIASTMLTAFASDGDFHTHPEDMPRREDVPSLQEYIKNPVRYPEWRKKTANFFFCLGYRLGKTLRELESQHEKNEKKLSDPKTQEYNRNFLDTIISGWEDDTKKRPNDAAKNPANKSSWRITMTYPDVVKIADPDAYKEHKDAWTQDEWPTSKEAYELVRKNLLREAHENNTMLWPLHLPYDSYATRYKVVDPTVWQKRLLEKTAEIWDNNDLDVETKRSRAKDFEAQLRKEQEEEEKKQDALAAQKQNLKTMRHEPVWTFGHPSRKKPVHLFWDINNWPVHLQSESRQRVIKSRGPARKIPDDEVAADIGDVAAFAEELQDLEEAAEVPFWKRAERRHKFVPLREEFWMGDTPLQRKEFEARMKRRLAPTSQSRKRTWGGALKEALFGSFANANEPVAASDEDFGLSSVPRHLIPQSRPAKRRRITEPLRSAGEEQERDLFAIARGEKKHRTKSNVLTIYSRSMSLEAGQVTFYFPEARIQGEGGVGDGMEVDEPMIEYVMPGKGR
ncbi:hypothetical protein TrVFT333_003614 [Trichoderma virens FT-333]|nr:hypothetical protein TrVFT333_003614 [Trichoderma virens FT-333]